MHRRDKEIAQKVIDTKILTGYPEKFRTTWGKNTSEQIFNIANMLHTHDLGKGITLARQTNSKETLKNVKRDNIKLEAYTYLEKKFNDLRIPIYAEMIMSLPGETYDSWIDGLGSLLESYVNNQIIIYPAEIYPNTEMNERSYREKYKIVTKQIKLHETHCAPKDQKWINEVQEIIVGTYSMTQEDWKKRNLFSIVLMTMHSFKVGFYIINFLKGELNLSGKYFLKYICNNTDKVKHPFIYKNLINAVDEWTNSMLNGNGKAIYNPKYSDVYLDIEEIIFLNISENFEKFYFELKDILRNFIGESKWRKNYEIIQEIFLYQDLRMPRIRMVNKTVNFNYNVGEYMFYFASNKKIKLRKNKNIIKTVNCKDYKSNYWEFTKKKIIWARKDDKIKNDLDFDNKILEKLKKIAKVKSNKKETNNLNNEMNIFEKLTKFKKYNSLDGKRNNEAPS